MKDTYIAPISIYNNPNPKAVFSLLEWALEWNDQSPFQYLFGLLSFGIEIIWKLVFANGILISSTEVRKGYSFPK